MKTNNVILNKSYDFALKIIEPYKQLKEKNEFLLSKQILRSGTSVGANCEEGASAQSKKDFINKFSIALKESRESHYWLRLLRDSALINEELANDLIKDCSELIKINTAILKTTRSNLD